MDPTEPCWRKVNERQDVYGCSRVKCASLADNFPILERDLISLPSTLLDNSTLVG